MIVARTGGTVKWAGTVQRECVPDKYASSQDVMTPMRTAIGMQKDAELSGTKCSGVNRAQVEEKAVDHQMGVLHLFFICKSCNTH